MKPSIMAIVVLTLLAPGAGADNWQTLNPATSPEARSGHSMVTINNQVYMFGGLSPAGSAQNDLWQFQKEASNWEAIVAGAPPPARQSHTAVGVDDKMYVFGGLDSDNTHLGDLWVYDTSTSSWSQAPAGPEARAYHNAASMNGKMVIFGGLGTDWQERSDVWVYDPQSSSWTQGADFPGGTGYGESTAVAGGKMYVMGQSTNEVYAYDPVQDAWSTETVVGPSPSARVLATSVQSDAKRSWVFGGENASDPRDYLGDTWEYDFDSKSWTQRTNVPVDMRQSGAASYTDQTGNEQVLVFGGEKEGGSYNGQTYVYTPTPFAGKSAELDRIEITPINVNIRVGDQKLFTAQGYDSNGEPVTIGDPHWEAEKGTVTPDPDDPRKGTYVADEQGNGYVICYAGPPETATVQASADIVNRKANSQLDRIEIMPRNVNIRVGGQKLFTAKAFDSNGEEVETTPNWSTTGGTISAGGGYTGTEAGTFTVTASVESAGVSQSTFVNVGPAAGLARVEITPVNFDLMVGDSMLCTAQGYDAAGNPVVWSNWYWSSTSGKVSVTPNPSDASECTVTGVTPGVDTIVCRSDTNEYALAGRTQVTVQSAGFPLFDIDVYPQFASVPVGASLALRATGYDMFGGRVFFIPEWSCDGGTVAHGIYTATAPGTFTVTCTGDGGAVTGEAVITVPESDTEPPSLDLDAGLAGLDYRVSHPVDAGPVYVTGRAGLTLTDPDSTTAVSARVTIVNLLDGANETLDATAPGRAVTVVYDAGTGTLELTGTDSLADYADTLRSVTYENTDAAPDTMPRQLEFTVNDGDQDSATATCEVFLTDDTIEYGLEGGWNLLSSPFDTAPWIPVADLLRDVEGNSVVVGKLWAWNAEAGRYEALVSGTAAQDAFWAYCVTGGRHARAIDTAPIDGRLRDGILRLEPGWDMVGPVVDVAATTIADLPQVTGPVWYWDEMLRAYRAVPADAILQRGRGYWVYVNEYVEVDIIQQDPRR